MHDKTSTGFILSMLFQMFFYALVIWLLVRAIRKNKSITIKKSEVEKYESRIKFCIIAFLICGIFTGSMFTFASNIGPDNGLGQLAWFLMFTIPGTIFFGLATIILYVTAKTKYS